MTDSQELKQQLKRIYDISSEMDILKRESDQLRSNLVSVLRENNLTKTKFDFGDKVVFYNERTDRQSLSQKLIKDYVATTYPSIDTKTFMDGLLSSRTVKHAVSVDVRKK